MAGIYFKVQADFEKIIRLRKEVDSLSSTLKTMNREVDPVAFDKLNKKLQSSSKELDALSKKASQTSREMMGAKDSASSLNDILVKIGGTAALTGLVSEVVRVRGEFQQLEIAFTTLLGSKEKAESLMAQMVETAAKTPFDLQGVAGGARQLLAYGFEAENVNDTLVRLGNVASGLGLPLERLTYLYGTTRVQGRLFARDMMQFTSSGIPLLQKLADMYGKTTEEVNDMVSAGKIGFPEVEKVFKTMTDEGGMFFNLMEEQSKSIPGQLSNLKDAIDEVLNEMGKQSQDQISGTIELANLLVENYEKVGKVLIALVATYGTYRTSLMILAATSKGYTVAQLAQYNVLLLVEKAQKLLNATILKNPYVLAATLIMGVVTAMWAFRDSTTANEKASSKFKGEVKSETEELNKLFTSLKQAKEGTIERKNAVELINKNYGQYLKNLLTEKSTIEEITNAQKESTKALTESISVRMKDEYLQGYAKDSQNAQITLYQEIANVSKKLTNEQKGIFEAYVENAIKNGSDGFRILRDGLAEATGSFKIDDLYSGWAANNFDHAVKDAYRTNKDLRKAEQDTKEIFDSYIKTLYPDKKEEKKTVFSDIKKEIENTKKTISKLKSELTDLRSGKTSSTDYKKDIEDKEKEVKDAEERLQTLTGVKEKEIDEQTKSANKLSELKTKQSLDQIRQDEDLQNKIKKSEVDKMAEGSLKTIAQMKLNHSLEMQELRRQKEDYIQDLISAEKAKFDADPKNKGKAFSSTVSLTAGQEAGFSLLSKSLMEKQAAELAETYKGLLKDYQTYAEKRLEIKNKYEQDLSLLTDKENIAQLRLKQKEALDAIDLEFASQSDSFELWMNEISEMSLTKLFDTLQKAQNALSVKWLNEGESTDVGVLRGKIATLQKQILSLQKGTSTRTTKEWKDTEEVLSKVNKELGEIGEGLGGAAGELISFAGELGTNVVSMINNITQLSVLSSQNMKGAAVGASKAIQMVEKASVILAIISAALQVYQKIKELLNDDAYYQYEIDYQNAKLKLQLDYNKALVDQIALQNDAFGGDKYANALAYTKAYYEALNNYSKQYEEAEFTRIKKMYGWKSLFSTALFGVFGSGKRDYETYNVNARQNLQIKTKEAKKGFLGIGGSHSKYENLEEWLKSQGYGDLFDKEGNLNLNLAKSAIEMKGVTDETKKYLQTLIDCTDQINEMNEELLSYIDDTFGELGDSMTNSIVDAFKNGKDAAQSFKSDIISVLETVGAQMARSLFVQKYIDAYSQSLQDIYKKQREGSEQENATSIANEVAKATSDYFKNLSEAQTSSNEWLKKYQEEAAKYGFDIYKPDEQSQSASSKGFQSMSQDTGSELNGRFTALQMAGEKLSAQAVIQTGHLNSIDEKMTSSVALQAQGIDVSSEIRDLTMQGLVHMAAISKNTSVLPEMAEDIKKVVKNTSNI